MKFKSEQFFAYGKRYPLYNNFQQQDKDKSFGPSNQESAANSRVLQGEPDQNDGDDDTATKRRSDEQDPPDSSARAKAAGSLSQNGPSRHGLNASATIEEH